MKNDLDNAINTDQAIFEKQMLGNDAGASDDKPTSGETVEGLKSAIKSTVAKLSSEGKQEMKQKLTDAKLPTNFGKVTDINILKQILATVSA